MFHLSLLECELGWYGPDCNVSCGNCNGSDVCFRTNGSCPGICSDGYTGDKCIASELDQLVYRHSCVPDFLTFDSCMMMKFKFIK